MFNKFGQIWPLVLSASLGFLLAAVLFVPRVYSNNQNIYRVLREKINVLQQIISYVNHFYFDTVDMDKVMDGAFHGLMEELDPIPIIFLLKNRKISMNYSRVNSRALVSNLIF